MPIRIKSILVFVFMLILPVLIITQLMLRSSQNILKDRVISLVEVELDQDILEMQRALEHHRSLVRSIASFPAIQGLMQANDSGSNSQFQVGETFWRDNLGGVFESLIRANPGIIELQLIDKSGQEVVRVEDQSGEIQRVAHEQLENQAHQVYFKDASVLQVGEIGISDADLNREKGELIVPVQPVVKMYVPIYKDGQFWSTVVLTLNISTQFSTYIFSETDLEMGNYGFFIDQDGYYIFHPQANLNFSKLLNPDQNFFVNEPEFSAVLNQQDAVTIFDASNRKYLISKKLHLSPDKFVVYVKVIDSRVLLSESKVLQQLSLLFFALGVIVTIIAFTTIGQHLIQPISLLSNIAKNLINDYSTAIYIPEKYLNRTDEIGILARSFKEMVEEIQRRNVQIRKQVDEQTKEIQKRNQQLERINRLMFNREVVMSDLKKQLEQKDDS